MPSTANNSAVRNRGGALPARVGEIESEYSIIEQNRRGATALRMRRMLASTDGGGAEVENIVVESAVRMGRTYSKKVHAVTTARIS